MRSLRSMSAVIAAISLLSATVPVALAQPAGGETPAPASTEKPWAKGVSAEDRATATALFKEGNGLLRDSFFVQAVEKYEAALSHWDHPSIHYNLAIALINVDKPLEVNMHLEKALAYDAAALSVEELELARSYKKLVEAQIVEVTVSCDLEGAQVFFDGKEAFVGPGKETRLMVAGEHTFAATKDGYEAAAVTRAMPGGTPQEITLRLYRPEDLTRYSRKFATWVPWAVTGGGVALLGIGGLLHASASSSYKDFDAWVDQCEADTGMACTPDSTAQGLRDGGDTKQTIAFVGYAIGGAAVVTGLTLLIINRAKPYRIDAETAGAASATVVPVIGRDEVGVSAAFRF